ncbi:ABC transporter ATP-binding protein [Pedobacter sp. AW31-3R]|uniref:ABC transporter ATP-binding protein n=1 Tax=Pedobacter sp. AW31-3R TaxID=3445781 RepID=UPI003FA10A56
MGNSAIKVENLSKAYQLGEIGTGTISRDLERWWAGIRGKEDPFLRVGETNDRTKKGAGNIVWSLRDLNADIEQGDAIGIIGRNGAGKSTLLKILSRVTSPTTGNVKIKGRIASLLEVGTGFHPELTGRENVYLNGAIMGMRKSEIRRKFDEIVDFAGVERYIDTPVKRYSSGMYVRLAFAVAAHLEAEILIVDEVLAVGDADFQKKCLGKMGEVSKGEGRTVLFVSHHMESIRSLCNKGMVLNNGQMIYQGEVATAISSYVRKTNEEPVKTSLLDHPLHKDVSLSLFEIDKARLISHEDLSFHLIIQSAERNNIQSVVLQIYNELEQKVGFMDLRCDELFRISATENKVEISGCMKHLPLIPGKYSVALHIQSNLLYKDFLNLLQFEVVQKELTNQIFPYPLSVRGMMEIDYSFHFNNGR